MTTHDQPDTRSLIAQITDHIRDLTQPHDHLEPYDHEVAPGIKAQRVHRTRVPALLIELGAGTTDTSTNNQDGTASYTSKPPASLDTIDALATIDLQATRWILDLTGTTPISHDTIDLVRHVGALAASADPVQQKAIERAVRGWRTMARVVTGWDMRPWEPDATCPACEKLGTLRIRFLDRVGMCVDPDCRAWWDSGTIGLLADHVRAEVAGRDGSHGRRRRCQVLGDYEPEDLEHLCRACGSARCLRAVEARLTVLAETPVDLDELDAEERAVEETRRARARSLRAWKAWGSGAAS